MAWLETTSPSFTARHEERDAEDVVGVLELLEGTRGRLASAFGAAPGEVAVVVHSSAAQLDLAQPLLPALRRLTAPAARRYLAGWASEATLHVLAPRVLVDRASSAPGSREMLLLTPAALYAQLVVGTCNPALPPPWRARDLRRTIRWAWLAFGAAQWFSGQTAHARPAIARRLREGARPAFPPGLRDAALLGGTVVDLLAREEGERAAMEMSCSLDPGGPRPALLAAFGGRAIGRTEDVWHTHLARIAEPEPGA